MNTKPYSAQNKGQGNAPIILIGKDFLKRIQTAQIQKKHIINLNLTEIKNFCLLKCAMKGGKMLDTVSEKISSMHISNKDSLMIFVLT